MAFNHDLVIEKFLDRSGRGLRVRRRGGEYSVDVDGLPGTESSDLSLSHAMFKCVSSFMVIDWRPRNEGETNP